MLPSMGPQRAQHASLGHWTSHSITALANCGVLWLGVTGRHTGRGVWAEMLQDVSEGLLSEGVVSLHQCAPHGVATS